MFYDELAIKSVIDGEKSFCKFLSANDTGKTGGHQSGIYIAKNSAELIFNKNFERGENIIKNPDAKLLQWIEMEYNLFRKIEESRYGEKIFMHTSARNFNSATSRNFSRKSCSCSSKAIHWKISERISRRNFYIFKIYKFC